MTCEACGAPARPPGKRGPKRTMVVCSDVCRLVVVYRRNRTPAPEVQTRPCRKCGRNFVAKKRRWVCDTCKHPSCACGQPKSKQAPRCRACAAASRVTVPVYTCKWCGGDYRPHSAERDQYCSRECNYAAKAGPAHWWPRCAVYFPMCTQCGALFTAQASNARICSDACRKRECAEKRKAAHRPDRVCRQCRATFAVQYGEKRRFCSDICRKAAEAQSKKQVRHKAKHRGRARFHGVAYEPISLRRVLIRDGWKCGICCKPISRAAKWPDLMCPSLDHVVPMSKGGPHLYANVQAAHFMCNSVKSDGSAGEQLRLLG